MGIDARQWLFTAIHGENRLREIPAGAPKYRVTDIKFASILVAAKYQLLAIDESGSGRVFFFLDDGNIDKKLHEFNEACDPENPLSMRPIAYMREALVWGDWWRKAIKSPHLSAQIMMMCKGRPLLINENATRQTLHTFFGG